MEATLPLSDLQQLREALNGAYYQNIALDMLEAYRALDLSGRNSQMTRQLERALHMVEIHVEAAQETDEQPVS